MLRREERSRSIVEVESGGKGNAVLKVTWGCSLQLSRWGIALRKSRLGMCVSWGDLTDLQEALLTGCEAGEEWRA